MLIKQMNVRIYVDTYVKFDIKLTFLTGIITRSSILKSKFTLNIFKKFMEAQIRRKS